MKHIVKGEIYIGCLPDVIPILIEEAKSFRIEGKGSKVKVEIVPEEERRAKEIAHALLLAKDPVCPKCGYPMEFKHGHWTCPKCGFSQLGRKLRPSRPNRRRRFYP